ncbi:MAG: hypothetical protein ACRCVK_19725 [Aeromonas veronii]
MKRITSRAHIERIKRMDCVLCGASGPSDAHHIRAGQGMGQRASDVLAIPLCKSCHQGPSGIHGDRAMMRIHKVDELDLLAITLERILNE